MGKSIHDDVLDAALSYLQDNGNEMNVCSQEPTTYTEAHSTYMLAQQALGAGDYTIANGDTSGRKVTVAEQADISVTNSGDATHVAIVDTVNSKLLLVTTCTTQTLTSGNTVTVPAFDDEIADPS